MIDLLSIARTEADGGDLFKVISNMFDTTDVKPNGYPEAIVWKGGNHDQDINPVTHSLTDAYALIGTLAAIDIMGLPFYAVPMWSQYRHDTKLACLSWFGNMPSTSINGPQPAMHTSTMKAEIELLYWENLVMLLLEHKLEYIVM